MSIEIQSMIKELTSKSEAPGASPHEIILTGLLGIMAIDINRIADAAEKIAIDHAELVTATKIAGAR